MIARNAGVIRLVSAIATCVFLVVSIAPDVTSMPKNPGQILRVGPRHTLQIPSGAAKIAADGATIEIDAGIYEDDEAVWTQNNLRIRAVGGRAHLRARSPIANGKAIWVIRGDHALIENVEFSGARVPDRNGAGVRGEGSGLTIRNCLFHDNENGILAGGGPRSVVVVENSEFAANGHGDGYSHNIYIVGVMKFVLRGSYSHHARVGHNVKSRAAENYLLYNRIMDEADGMSSYAVDLPNGGVSYLIGNVIQKGARSKNSRVIAYGAEGLRHAVNELYVVNNTIVNEDRGGGAFVRIWGSPASVKLINNLFVGRGAALIGVGELRHNLVTDKPGLIDQANFDYRLKAGSPAIHAGTDPGAVNGFGLTPTSEYVRRANHQVRHNVGRLDVGAYEYKGSDVAPNTDERHGDAEAGTLSDARRRP